MAKMRTSVVLSILLVSILFILSACASGVSQQEYDRIYDELSETKSKLADAAKWQVQYEELDKSHEVLKKQYDTETNKVSTIESKYNDLTTKYENLEKQFGDLSAKYEELKQYDAIPGDTAAISKEDLEQALFEAINKERNNKGLNELKWGKLIYLEAEKNNRYMEETGSYQYSEELALQEVFIAAGYSTLDRITNGALLTWRIDSFKYENNILSKVAIYGAINVYKSGDIFYITYAAGVYE